MTTTTTTPTSATVQATPQKPSTAREGDERTRARSSPSAKRGRATPGRVVATREGVTRVPAALGVWPVVPKGRGVHGYVSGYRLKGKWTGCPHWEGGNCKRGEPADDPCAWPDCAVGGWGPGARRCDYLEANLLPDAPEDVREDYRYRTLLPRRAAGEQPDRGSAAPHAEDAGEAIGPQVERVSLVRPETRRVTREEYEARVERECLAAGVAVVRTCPRCGELPVVPGKKLCPWCRRAARTATIRRVQAKRRRRRA